MTIKATAIQPNVARDAGLAAAGPWDRVPRSPAVRR